MANVRLIFKISLILLIFSFVRASCYDPPTIKGKEDLEQIQGCDYIGRSITVTSEFEGKLSLPNLSKVNGKILINGSKINEIDLSNLADAQELYIANVRNLKKFHLMDFFKGDYLIINSLQDKIETLDFTFEDIEWGNLFGKIELSNIFVKNLSIKRPKIEYVKLSSLSGIKNLNLDFNYVENLELESISNVEKINLEFSFLVNLKLNSCTDLKIIEIHKIEHANKLEIRNNPMLESIILLNIDRIDELNISNNTMLKKTILPNVNTIEKITISNNEMLKSLILPNIKKLLNFKIFESPGFETLSFDGLEKSENLFFKDLPNIELLSFPKLMKISENANFENNPKVKINMPILEYVGDNASFINIAEVVIPVIKELGSIRYRSVTSLKLNLRSLERVDDFVLISSNDKLTSINFSKLNKVQQGEFTIDKNEILSEISIPSLIYVNDLKIDQPTINKIDFNEHLFGDKFKINSLINCNKLKDLKFNLFNCSNPQEASLLPSKPKEKDTTDQTEPLNSKKLTPTDATSDQNPPIKTESNTRQESSSIPVIKNQISKENKEKTTDFSSNRGVIDYQENLTTSHGFSITLNFFTFFLFWFYSLW